MRRGLFEEECQPSRFILKRCSAAMMSSGVSIEYQERPVFAP